MIKIEKGKAPEFLSSEKVEIARERMRTFYASNREQKRYLFPFNKEIDIKLKEDLHKIFYTPDIPVSFRKNTKTDGIFMNYE